MSRTIQYRREISDACSWHQDQALNSTIYILYQTGPTGFLLKEDGENKNLKVFLGDLHSCTCSVFKKEKDLCKHICWVLLKKFRVSRTDPLSWQLGLNEREINQIIRGDTSFDHKSKQKILPKKINSNDSSSNSNEVEQRAITESDVCPICQDEFLSKKLPVSFCKCCGNNVHIKCMKVWADHQKSNGETELKCPLCREIFNTFDQLDLEYRNNGLFKLEKQDLHYGLTCNSCKSTPINGKCYKCTVCSEFYLCQGCFNTDFHQQHSFVFREKITQKYHKANRDHVGIIPAAVAQNLATRDINDQDYELLLQLTSNTSTINTNNSFSQIPEKVIKSWPLEKIKENNILMGPGIQCRICLRSFQVNQLVRKLPSCKHKFHSDCIDNWLIHSHPTCPIDGQIVWDPITAQLEKDEKKSQKSNDFKNLSEKPTMRTNKKEADPPVLDLVINFKHCIIENKKPFSDLVTNELKRFESAPNIKLKNKKLRDKRTASIPNNDVKNLNTNLQDLENKNSKIKSIEALKTQFPPIEMKSNSKTILDTSPHHLQNDLLINSIIGTKSTIKLNEAYGIIVNKPYQLSRFPTTHSASSSLSTKPSISSESNHTDENEELNNQTTGIDSEFILNQPNVNESSFRGQINTQNNHLLFSNQNIVFERPQLVSNKQKIRTHHPPLFKKLNKSSNLVDKGLALNNKQSELLPIIVGIKPNNELINNNDNKDNQFMDLFD